MDYRLQMGVICRSTFAKIQASETSGMSRGGFATARIDLQATFLS